MRTMTRSQALLASALLLVSAWLMPATAGAVPITYGFSATGSGTIGGRPFTNAPYTITVVGDTNGVVTSGGIDSRIQQYVGSAMSIAIAGNATAFFSGPVYVECELGFSFAGDCDLRLGGYGAAFISAPIGANCNSPPLDKPFVEQCTALVLDSVPVTTNLGPFVLASSSDPTFAGAVPAAAVSAPTIDFFAKVLLIFVLLYLAWSVRWRGRYVPHSGG